jgi:hypothetical protein
MMSVTQEAYSATEYGWCAQLPSCPTWTYSVPSLWHAHNTLQKHDHTTCQNMLSCQSCISYFLSNITLKLSTVWCSPCTYVPCCLHTCRNLHISVMLGQGCHHNTVTECQVFTPKLRNKTINIDWNYVLNYISTVNASEFQVSILT